MMTASTTMILILVTTAAALAACSDAAEVRDASREAADFGSFDGMADGGTSPDARSSTDASGDDSGSILDAGSTVDASTSPDSGSVVDAGSTVDANTSADSGSVVDAGSTVDASTSPDSGSVVDSGPTCPNPSGQPTPSATMSFFATSVGNGTSGGNLGGLAGADARCQCLAGKVGLGAKNWRAYLSTAPNPSGPGGLVNARDRIGVGPWFNYAGVEIASDVAALHSSPPAGDQILTETGVIPAHNEHDMFTGSGSAGVAETMHPNNPAAPPPNCGNWTSGSDFDTAIVGHSDWDTPSGGAVSWNASHVTNGCDPVSLAATGAVGRLYCFAID